MLRIALPQPRSGLSQSRISLIRQPEITQIKRTHFGSMLTHLHAWRNMEPMQDADKFIG